MTETLPKSTWRCLKMTFSKLVSFSALVSSNHVKKTERCVLLLFNHQEESLKVTEKSSKQTICSNLPNNSLFFLLNVSKHPFQHFDSIIIPIRNVVWGTTATANRQAQEWFQMINNASNLKFNCSIITVLYKFSSKKTLG